MGIKLTEQSVIGAVIISNGKLLDDFNLSSKDFYEYEHQRLWSQLLANKKSDLACDAVTLISDLPADAEIIWDCVDACYSVELAGDHAKQIKSAANERKLKDTAENVLHSQQSLPDAIKLLNDTLNSLEGNGQVSFTTIGDDFDSHLLELQKPNTNAKSGLGEIDENLEGFRPGALYVIGARPGVGKTVVGLQMALGLARSGNELSEDERAGLVLFYSLEMSKREIMNRLIAQTTGVTVKKLDSGKLSKTTVDEIKKHRSSFSRLLSVNDSGGQSIASIREYARTMARTAPLRAIVVDYLGLISDISKFENRYEGTTFVSGELKRLAKDLNVPVIALAQLNRDSAKSKARPTMADLRDSGSVEQDADVVILLYRDLSTENTRSEIELLTVKNRHGKQDEVVYVFYGETARIGLPAKMPENH
jgi:replicative DNA helicase